MSSDRTSTPPLPGRPVEGSRTGRPINAALDLLSRRWTLRILWELRDGPRGFREMRQRCDRMSPDTLTKRISDLEAAGLVSRDANGQLDVTDIGRRLDPVLRELYQWSEDWAEGLTTAPER